MDQEGRSKHAGRYTVYHYRGSGADIRSCRSKIILGMMAASCTADDAGLAVLTDTLANASVSSTLAGSPTIWTVAATIGDLYLEQQRDLSRNIYYRRVNGTDYAVDSLSINGIDATSLLGQ